MIDEETGLMNVKADTIRVVPHFRPGLQLRSCKKKEINAKERQCRSILSRVIRVIWTIPTDGDDTLIYGTVWR
jgi:hypothetical protein